MEIRPDILAESLTAIPVTAGGGQPGPLSQLELVGTLGVLGRSDQISINQWRNGLERLQAVLVERGCHSIKQLDVDFIDGPVDEDIFAALSVMEAFTRTVCVKPDIPVSINVYDAMSERAVPIFDLSLLCEVPTRPAPSFFVQKHIQQLAADTPTACFVIAPHHFTTPLDTPSPSAVALARCMTFLKADQVEVFEQGRFLGAQWEPDADAEPPNPTVIDQLPASAFPTASRLYIYSTKGYAIGKKLASKMPAVRDIELYETMEADAVGVLEAVGGGGSPMRCEIRHMTAVSEEGLRWGDKADELPSIEQQHVCVEVPEDLGHGDAAGEFGVSCVSSLLKIRGIEELKLRLEPPAAFQSFKRLVRERRHGDTIEGLPGRFDSIGWTTHMGIHIWRPVGACFLLKPKSI
ncbi:unnamed protein product [Vitrella brassicaformis CCMP3155]|uniref:Uncharacterized protein n=1 Tax=Vitrella brassicaformis (strain CCMP3155) TaxID=1169540 RepID=A0A0G4E944_VITBC|nr:unnamed protein product [Vitrella brassicaformis CCMP3155]|eukprot:CEL91721.1 unnamed protein product [Vitrella brassicaformis CCMP3155]